MGLFSRKKKDVENKKVDMTEVFKDTILQEALKENVDKQSKIIDSFHTSPPILQC